MLKNSIRWVVVLGVLAVGLGLVLWASQQATVRPVEARLTVAATIFPLADIARAVAGDAVNVVLLIPPGASEHSYSLTPQQLRELQTARVLFRVGHGLEDRLTGRLAETLPQLRLVTVDSGIVLREFSKDLADEQHAEPVDEEEHHHDEGEDPHYWLTAPNAQKIAVTVAETLQQMDPEHAAEYRANLKQYQAQLDSLERELQVLAKSAPKKEFIAMHNAWGYFAVQYGFRLLATYEPVEGQEPSLADLQHIKTLVGQYGLKTFYAEPQKASTAVTSFMQREFGLAVRTLDPVGGVEGRESYTELMRFNLQALTNGGAGTVQ